MIYSGIEGLAQNLPDIYGKWTVFPDILWGCFGKCDTDEAFSSLPKYLACTLGSTCQVDSRVWAVAQIYLDTWWVGLQHAFPLGKLKRNFKIKNTKLSSHKHKGNYEQYNNYNKIKNKTPRFNLVFSSYSSILNYYICVRIQDPDWDIKYYLGIEQNLERVSYMPKY